MAETKNELAEQKPKTKTFSLALSEKLDGVQDALPKDFNKARFVQNALALINDNPALQKYNQTQLMSGLMRASYLNLDFINRECYLIPYGSQLNYQTSYKGDIKLAKKYSPRTILDIHAELIRKGDEFSRTNINGQIGFTHNPKFPQDKEIVGAYAYVKYADGGINLDVMSIDELENTRKHSKMSNGGAWRDFTGEMYKKTVLRRLCKYIDMDFENPVQRNVFDEDMAIETDTEKVVAQEIAENANSEEFIISDTDFEEPPFMQES